MYVRIDVPGDAVALEDLGAWLRAERALRGRVQLRAAEPQPGTMGADVELVLSIAELGVAVLGSVVAAVDLWLGQRPARRGGGAPAVRVTRPDGVSFDFNGGPDEVARLVAALSEHLGDGPGGAGTTGTGTAASGSADGDDEPAA
ncbi:hypothetical protein [Streptomyces sp. NPDC101132]|uniref:effector-associated constant component EACC1 n=1 Tax=Streptomyces sp. NPDC101132 TaxID=3366110 RepID=UPI003818A44E